MRNHTLIAGSRRFVTSTCNHLPVTQKFQDVRTGNYTFKPPELKNQYTNDVFLQKLLKTLLPKEVLSVVEPDLTRFGDVVAGPAYKLHLQCEAEPPRLERYDGWGNRIDRLITSEAWKQQKRLSAEEGLVAIGHEREYQQYSRIYQAAKLMLYGPSAGLYSCPLAMTDGAARTLELLANNDRMKAARDRLISKNPDKFWTSGQWMTEKGGGSDVGAGTESIAVRQSDGSFLLHGYKWFSSATDSDMSLALARITDQHGNITEGSRGLSMFYIEMKTPDGSSNNIRINNLKNKLGTRQLPTAELLLDGTTAHLIGEEGRGISSITDMLRICRFYNCVFAASPMRRMVYLAREYSKNREAFGKKLQDHPLHMKTLSDMELNTRVCSLLVLELSRLIGLVECNLASDEDFAVLRILTPISKLYTAKISVSTMSEGLECFGGQGYIEDTGLPSMLRDAQVLPIWEGTTNILSHDLLRAIYKSKGESLKVFLNVCTQDVADEKSGLISSCLYDINWVLENSMKESSDAMVEMLARDLAWKLTETYIGALLFRLSKVDPWFSATFNRWCQRDFPSLKIRLERGLYTSQQVSRDKQFLNHEL